MMRTRCLILSLVVGFGVASARPSAADDKSHAKAAEELLVAMGIDTQLQKSLEQTLEIQMKANPALVPFKDVMYKFFSKHLSYDSLKPDLVKIYADTFSEDELKQIKVFYETPIGKKLVEKLPDLNNKAMQLGASRVQANQNELKEMIQEEAKAKQ